MQYHYAIGYDTDMKKWFVELDTTSYFPDGNVWSDENIQKFGFGWSYPEDDTAGAALDQTLLDTLQHIIDIIPIPQEVGDNAARERGWIC